jgi:hypothetical protein
MVHEDSRRRTHGKITEAMNRVCAEIGCASDEFVAEASRRILKRSEW